jgi:MFS transporter, OFA family, oxalate/formate antiporter
MSLTFGLSNSYTDFFLPLSQEFGWNHAITSTIPAVSLMTFSLGSLLSGFTLSKVGFRRMSYIGSVMVGSGILLSSKISSFTELLITFGIIAPLGISIVAAAGNSIVIKWFIKRRGVAVGMTTAGSGVGTLVIPPVAELLIVNQGWRTAFFALGVAFLAFMLITSFFMQLPEDVSAKPYGWGELNQKERDNIQEYTAKKALSTWKFWLIYSMFFLGAFASSIFLVHASPIAKTYGISEIAASEAVGVFGLGSLTGRIVMSGISTTPARARNLMLAFSAELFGVLALTYLGKIVPLFFVCAFFIGIGYGGILADSLALTGDLFGMKTIERTWSIQETAYGLAGLSGPIIAGFYFDSYGGYTGILQTTTVALAVALFISFRFQTSVKKSIDAKMRHSDRG